MAGDGSTCSDACGVANGDGWTCADRCSVIYREYGAWSVTFDAVLGLTCGLREVVGRIFYMLTHACSVRVLGGVAELFGPSIKRMMRISRSNTLSSSTRYVQMLAEWRTATTRRAQIDAAFRTGMTLVVQTHVALRTETARHVRIDAAFLMGTDRRAWMRAGWRTGTTRRARTDAAL